MIRKHLLLNLHVPGLLGLSGCVKVAMDFGSYGKGWAFYVSLAASCIEMLKVSF